MLVGVREDGQSDRRIEYTRFGSIDFFQTWRHNGIVSKVSLCKV